MKKLCSILAACMLTPSIVKSDVSVYKSWGFDRNGFAVEVTRDNKFYIGIDGAVGDESKRNEEEINESTLTSTLIGNNPYKRTDIKPYYLNIQMEKVLWGYEKQLTKYKIPLRVDTKLSAGFGLEARIGEVLYFGNTASIDGLPDIDLSMSMIFGAYLMTQLSIFAAKLGVTYNFDRFVPEANLGVRF